MKWATYNVYKIAEGGMGQRMARSLALVAGAHTVRTGMSMYVGQTAIWVLANSRVHRKVSKLLYE